MIHEQPPIETAAQPPEFSKEDWFVIDEVLHRVAKALRKIEQEEKPQKQQEAADQ